MKNLLQEIRLDAVFVEDPESKKFTAFFAQFPNIVAEGNNTEDATANLFKLMNTVFEHQKQEEELVLQNSKGCDFGKVTTVPFRFATSFA